MEIRKYKSPTENIDYIGDLIKGETSPKVESQVEDVTYAAAGAYTLNTSTERDQNRPYQREYQIFDGREAIEFMSDEKDYPNDKGNGYTLGHYNLRRSDYKTKSGKQEKSFSDELIKKIDGKDIDYRYFSFFKTFPDSYWNTSVKTLVKNLTNYLKKYDSTVDDSENILDANAAWSFKGNNNYVIPEKNLNNEEYSYFHSPHDEIRNGAGVRNIDYDGYRNASINNKNKNETNILISDEYGVNLIMPQYNRIVEVEDLNRNFWVIGTVIDTICENLFSNSPLWQIVDQINDEIVQLWENTVYLWVEMILLRYREVYSDTKIFFIPVCNSDFQPYVKYDNFTDKAGYKWNETFLGKGIKYSLLNAEPENWKDNYQYYYYQKENKYYSLEGWYPDFNTSYYTAILLEEQPEGWGEDSYYEVDENEDLVLIESGTSFEPNKYYEVKSLSEKPEDWEDNYFNYYMIKETDVFTHLSSYPLFSTDTYYKMEIDVFGFNKTLLINNASVNFSFIKEVNYLMNKYSQSNLIIIPEIRKGNYKSNQYHFAYYPGVYFSKRLQASSASILRSFGKRKVSVYPFDKSIFVELEWNKYADFYVNEDKKRNSYYLRQYFFDQIIPDQQRYIQGSDYMRAEWDVDSINMPYFEKTTSKDEDGKTIVKYYRDKSYNYTGKFYDSIYCEPLMSEPEDWRNNYTNYFQKVGEDYAPIVGPSAPTFQPGEYYEQIFFTDTIDSDISTERAVRALVKNIDKDSKIFTLDFLDMIGYEKFKDYRTNLIKSYSIALGENENDEYTAFVNDAADNDDLETSQNYYKGEVITWERVPNPTMSIQIRKDWDMKKYSEEAIDQRIFYSVISVTPFIYDYSYTEIDDGAPDDWENNYYSYFKKVGSQYINVSLVDKESYDWDDPNRYAIYKKDGKAESLTEIVQEPEGWETNYTNYLYGNNPSDVIYIPKQDEVPDFKTLQEDKHIYAYVYNKIYFEDESEIETQVPGVTVTKTVRKAYFKSFCIKTNNKNNFSQVLSFDNLPTIDLASHQKIYYEIKEEGIYSVKNIVTQEQLNRLYDSLVVTTINGQLVTYSPPKEFALNTRAWYRRYKWDCIENDTWHSYEINEANGISLCTSDTKNSTIYLENKWIKTFYKISMAEVYLYPYVWGYICNLYDYRINSTGDKNAGKYQIRHSTPFFSKEGAYFISYNDEDLEEVTEKPSGWGEGSFNPWQNRMYIDYNDGNGKILATSDMQKDYEWGTGRVYKPKEGAVENKKTYNYFDSFQKFLKPYMTDATLHLTLYMKDLYDAMKKITDEQREQPSVKISLGNDRKEIEFYFKDKEITGFNVLGVKGGTVQFGSENLVVFITRRRGNFENKSSKDCPKTVKTFKLGVDINKNLIQETTDEYYDDDSGDIISGLGVILPIETYNPKTLSFDVEYYYYIAPTHFFEAVNFNASGYIGKILNCYINLTDTNTPNLFTKDNWMLKWTDMEGGGGVDHFKMRDNILDQNGKIMDKIIERYTKDYDKIRKTTKPWETTPEGEDPSSQSNNGWIDPTDPDNIEDLKTEINTHLDYYYNVLFKKQYDEDGIKGIDLDLEKECFDTMADFCYPAADEKAGNKLFGGIGWRYISTLAMSYIYPKQSDDIQKNKINVIDSNGLMMVRFGHQKNPEDSKAGYCLQWDWIIDGYNPSGTDSSSRAVYYNYNWEDRPKIFNIEDPETHDVKLRTLVSEQDSTERTYYNFNTLISTDGWQFSSCNASRFLSDFPTDVNNIPYLLDYEFFPSNGYCTQYTDGINTEIINWTSMNLNSSSEHGVTLGHSVTDDTLGVVYPPSAGAGCPYNAEDYKNDDDLLTLEKEVSEEEGGDEDATN